MTLVPECVLAREAELCYASIAIITDYDVWKDHLVSADEVATTMKNCVEKVKRIILETVARLPKELSCDCNEALSNAFL
jgi:5'-methylthioadenosine phosphorylase